jgi:RNA polymerase primary sigma factor
LKVLWGGKQVDNVDSNLKFYLSQLNDVPLLTREEENELLRSVEIRQNKILRDCLASEFFKAELLALLKSQSLSEIVNISRKLDDESPKAQIAATSELFVQLVESLETETAQEGIQKLLDAVSLSGTILDTLVTRIRKKFAKIQTYESDLATFLRFFEVKTEPELVELVEKIKSDEMAKKYLSRKFMTTEQRLMSRVYEYGELVDSLKVLEEMGINRQNFEEIKGIYSSVNSTEKEMKRFKDELISRNLRLVISRAKKFVNRGLDFEDLVQEGNIGLIKAINKHDSSRGTKISTYATWWIDQTIRRAISNKSKTVRIPTHIEFLQTQLSTITTKLTNELGHPPTKEEIAKRAKIDVEVLDRLEHIAIHKVGIDDEMSSGVSMMDILPSDPTENPFNLTAKKMLREKIRQILATLPPRTEKIIRLRFGIGEPHEEMTLQEIADSVGLTKMGVRLVQNKGLEKMKKKGDLTDEC